MDGELGGGRSNPKAVNASAEEVLQTELQAMETELLWLTLDEKIDIVAKLYSILKAVDKLVHHFFGPFPTETTGENPQPRMLSTSSVGSHLQARTHKLGVNASAQLLEAIHDINSSRSSGATNPGLRKKPKKSIIQFTASSYLRHAIELRIRQLEYLGPYHPDLIRY